MFPVVEDQGEHKLKRNEKGLDFRVTLILKRACRLLVASFKALNRLPLSIVNRPQWQAGNARAREMFQVQGSYRL